MAQWLVKEEPEHYGYDQLERDRTTVWAGVRNPLAQMHVVDIAPDTKLSHAVTLAAIKADRAFASFPLVRMSRLSVMPVTDAEWARIVDMSKA